MSFLNRNRSTPVEPAPIELTMKAVSEVSPTEIEDSQEAQGWADIKSYVHSQLLELLGPTLYDSEDEADLEQKVKEAINSVLEAAAGNYSEEERARLRQEIEDDILRYGPIEPLLRDSEVTEVMVNSFNKIFVERKGTLHETKATFIDEAHLRRTIDKIVSKVGRRVDEASPMVDARLLDGSRVNAVIPPIALHGSSLTIRKFSTEPFTHQDLIGFGTMTEELADFIERCVRGRLNVVISGGTGSGKTTTLNVLSSFIPPAERIVTIEDAAELRLQQPHVVSLESRPNNTEGKGQISIRELVKNSLRMRPDRIVVGEIRDGAALDMLQAMNTGHDGSITTLHSNGPRDTLSRLETMVLMAGMDLPMRAIREQVASAVDVIVHQSRLRDGTRRIEYVTEVLGMESEVITTQDIFKFDFSQGLDENGKFRGTIKSTGLRPTFSSRLLDQGIDLPPSLFGGGY